MSNKKTELYHHGIPGQKWGVRRFQDEDGTLTPEGQKRYGNAKKVLDGSSNILDKASKLGLSQNKSKTVKKDYSDIKSEDLKKMVERLNLEEQYGRLTGDTKKVKTGYEWVNDVLQNTAILVGMAGTAVGIFLSLKRGK